MIFSSDNWAGAHPRVAEALSAAAGGYAPAYGASELDRKVADRFNEIFEREVAVFFVGTGTAANALAMSAFSRPGGVVFAHSDAHMVVDECGAPEFFSDAMRLRPVPGREGRIDPKALETAIAAYPPAFVHSGQPAAISITQASEIGTVYSTDEIGTIAGIAKRHGLPLHMDGARFANALVALDISPAQMTWKLGVDAVSFGGTKNGCWCAEALVFMDPEKAKSFPFIRKRAAQLFSKSRFIAAQFDAYLDDNHWLETARHANAMTRRLADLFEASPAMRLGWRPQANEVFPIMPAALADALRAKGAAFHPWPAPVGMTDKIGPDETLCRFVTSFATTDEEVDALAALL